MAEHCNEWIFDRFDDAPSHVGFGKIENRMNGGDDEIQLRQQIVRKIKLPVAENVALDAGEKTKAIEFFIQLPNRRDLFAQLRLGQPVALHAAFAMLGDAEVFESELLRRGRHFFERIVTVTRDGVTMNCAA